MDGLTMPLAQQCAQRMPEVLRSALEGRSLTGLDACLEGLAAEELCHPLRAEQLEQIRACVSFTRREVQVIPVMEQWAPEKGLLVFRVRYDIAGRDADGNAVEVQQEGAMALTCAVRGGHGCREVMRILGMEPCRLLEDGSVKRPGFLERRLRRWQRKTRRGDVAETVGEGLLELLGMVVEFLLDALFDGV